MKNQLNEPTLPLPQEKSRDFTQAAVKVSLVSIVGNALLSVLKLIAGILAHSGAMVSDAVHSASDVFSSIIVIIGVKLSAREADREHPYGHERFECVAAIILSAVLLITGVMIGKSALDQLLANDYGAIAVPGVLALAAAVVSILSKEGMFWYTRFYAKKLDSPALMANAWHHRSDSLSSVGALVGIVGARMGFKVLEPVASLIICAFIFKAAYDIFRDSVSKMVDHSCDDATEKAIAACAAAQENVLGVDLIQTREFGNRIYVDIEIRADGRLTLRESHEIAEQVHNAIEKNFDKVKHIMVHVNPAES